jgi:RNase adaptor protein for sRNA GlmZ degradation
MTDITITSFGHLHGPAPEAEITLDLRHHFRDPHVSPELRHLTADDEAVREAVRTTPGIMPLVAAAAAMAQAYLSGPGAADTPVRIAAGCAGGRRRAASVALEIRDALAKLGVGATIVDRDSHRDVVER